MNNLDAKTVKRAAAGAGWLRILTALAPELDTALARPGRHTGCPVHGGNDGFRLFKDVDSSGGGICNTCGGFNDGFSLLSWLKGWSFPTVVEEVGAVLGISDQRDEKRARRENLARSAEVDAKKAFLAEQQAAEDAKLKQWLNKVWTESFRLDHPEAEPARYYFRGRGILLWDEPEILAMVRLHPNLPAYNQQRQLVGYFPAVVALIGDETGKPVAMQRIFINRKGVKADLDEPKKMTPIPSDWSVTGGAIRLGRPENGILGVAEGIETALAVRQATGQVVWPTVNATLLERFVPPEGVTEVVIWADKDRVNERTGVARGIEAANELKRRLWGMKVKARIHLPSLEIPQRTKGVDWNDVLLQQGVYGFPNTPLELREGVRVNEQGG